jgi:hypothetical protein
LKMRKASQTMTSEARGGFKVYKFRAREQLTVVVLCPTPMTLELNIPTVTKIQNGAGI